MEQTSKSIAVGTSRSTIVTTSRTLITIRTESCSMPSPKAAAAGEASDAIDLQARIHTILPSPPGAVTNQTTCDSSACDLAKLCDYDTTAELPSSPVTTPPVSVISDPFCSSAGSSFTSTSSSDVMPLQALKPILKNATKYPEETMEPDDENSDDETSETDSHDSFDNHDDEEKEEDGYEDSDTESEDEESDDDYYDDEGSDIGVRDSFSFISFGNNVRFAETETIIVISSRHERESALDGNMTFHERMLLAQASRQPDKSPSLNGREYDPEEHTRDVVDLDRDLLIAYINGLRTVDVHDCKEVLRARTLNIDIENAGRKALPSETEVQMNEYLDRIVETLLGFFPNLFTEDEYSHILDQAECAIAFDDSHQHSYQPESVNVQQMLRKILEEKLMDDTTSLTTDILGWLAGELLEPLGRLAFARKPSRN